MTCVTAEPLDMCEAVPNVILQQPWIDLAPVELPEFLGQMEIKMASRVFYVSVIRRLGRALMALRYNGTLLPTLGALAFLVSLAWQNHAQAQQSDATTTISLATHHLSDIIAKGQVEQLGRLPVGQHLQLAIVLPIRNQAQLDALLKDLYDPKSSNYRKFLSVQDFTDRFGPTQADYAALVQYVTNHGMTVKGTHPNRLVLSVDAPVSAINDAFNVTMKVYKHPTESRRFYSPDREPTVNFGVALWHITGLDDLSISRRASLPGSSPGGGYTGADFRAAYSAGALTGAGQSIGLLGGSFRIEDVRAYFEFIGQPFHAGAVRTVSVDGADTSCPLSDDCGELAIDIEQALSMAPGLDSVIVYEGVDSAVFSRMATDNIAKQLSTSLTFGADPQTDDPIFDEFALQGQTLFAASMDSGSYVLSACQQGVISACSPYPSENAFVTAVGGTTLTTTGPGGAWASETAWGGSGGGISTDGVPIPPYQASSGIINNANQGSTTLRNLPDVAGYADQNSYVCANGNCGTGVTGTSFASPRWAAVMALVNQQMVGNGDLPQGSGWLNQYLYVMGWLGQLQYDFHDITQGNNFHNHQQLYSAVPGYDLVTGWGSPRVQNLANDFSGVGACWQFIFGYSSFSRDLKNLCCSGNDGQHVWPELYGYGA